MSVYQYLYFFGRTLGQLMSPTTFDPHPTVDAVDAYLFSFPLKALFLVCLLVE